MSAVPSDALRLASIDYDPFAGGEILTTAPSSEPQREVWMAARMGPEASCAYNESFTLSLRGDLDVEALQRALGLLSARHEALRTTFTPDGATLCVSAESSLRPEYLDLRSLSPDRRDARVADLVRWEVEEPFDLEHGPLARAKIARLEDDLHHLVFTAHHIVCDGWSTAILIRELRDLYRAAHAGSDPPSDAAPRFSAYAVEQAERRATSGDEEYWIRQFEGSVPVLDLPADGTRGGGRTFASRRYEHVIERELVAALKKTAAAHRCSFFSLLFAGFTAYLHRLTGDDDIVVGVPAAGQSSPGWGALVGHCVNLLPIRTVIDGARPFNHHMQRTRGLVLDAFEHKDYTFGSLIQRLPIPRDPGRVPLVSVMFNLDRSLGDELAFDGLDVTFRSNPRHFENFELFVNAVERDGALVLECQYNLALFSKETVRSRLAGYEALLRAAAEDPERPLSTLPLMSDEELDRILVQWNDTDEPAPHDLCLDELFVAQARRTPDAVAVRGRGGSLTYAELDRRSDALARRLRALGVGPGTHTGVALSRSPWLVVGLLAVLKAGGTYVPLDPEYPARRIAFMLEDSGAGTLLTEAALADRFPASEAQVVLVDDESATRTDDLDGAALEERDPGAPAYVIYTSGSTGQPKGVQISHRSVVSFLTSMARAPGLDAEDVLLAVTTVCFDISVLELFLPLTVGARTHIADEEEVRDPRRLADLLENEGITAMQATPATWQMLVDAGWRGRPTFKALSGGEAISSELARELVARTDEAWNLYGPTETTVWSTRYRLGNGESLRGSPPIGRPIGNTRVYLLDESGQPVPIGVPGELHIGGAGVAIGYLNRPELTAERFVPDPFAPGDTPRRLYRTGDQVRWTADGLLQFEKRIDTQVKVRGFRIELGEIDANLMDHPDVVTSATLAFAKDAGDTRLASFYVGANGADVSSAELRAHLSERLPPYMVPQHFTRLPTLPRTLNGKIDRKALRAMKPDDRSDRPPSVAPHTETERALAAIWCDVLGVERVGAEDDFFDLGGHSILAVRVTARLAEDLGIEVSLKRVMATPVLRALAHHIETIQGLRDAEGAAADEPDTWEEVEF